MKLYYTNGACSLACRIIINEIGLPCDFIAVDLKTKKIKNGEDFLEINPKGSVPVLVTNDNHILTENAVIQQYLADMNHAIDLLPSVGDFKRYQVLEWLNYVATELHKGFSIFFNPTISQDLKENIFAPLLEKKLSYVDSYLKDKNYLVEDFTLPDAYLFVVLTWGLKFNINHEGRPHLKRYFDRLKNRKSVEKSLEEERISLS